MKNNKAFTLVELIVVVTILAILSTIGFVSYSGYLAGVRDTNRIAQLKAIGDALHLYSTNKSLPTPDDKIDIKTNIKIIGYQGYIGKDAVETIGYTAEGLDPKDNTYYSYYLTKDKKYFQLMAFLEEEQGLVSKLKINNRVNAEIDYETRYPRVEGSKLGILTGTGGAPIQELITTGEIDLVTESIGITSILSNSETQTGTTLAGISSDHSCKRLYEVGGKRISGIYKIDPSGDGVGFKVYCDMETDGGGWTFFGHYNDDSNGTGFFTGIGTYKIDRKDDDTKYSIDISNLGHNEMMVSIDSYDTQFSTNNDKLLFFKYDVGSPAFNSGPTICSGLADNMYQFKLGVDGDYTNGGSAQCTNSWWNTNHIGSTTLILLRGANNGVFWGTGMGGNNSWNHDGYFYVR